MKQGVWRRDLFRQVGFKCQPWLLFKMSNWALLAFRGASVSTGNPPPRRVDAKSILSSERPQSSTAPPFPLFFHETTRPLSQTLNVYFVLINADIKFRRFLTNFGIDKLHPDMRAVVRQTRQIVDLMYTRPVRKDEHDDTGMATEYTAPLQMKKRQCQSIVFWLLQMLHRLINGYSQYPTHGTPSPTRKEKTLDAIFSLEAAVSL
jgi:hypothetical protein